LRNAVRDLGLGLISYQRHTYTALDVRDKDCGYLESLVHDI